MELNLVQPTQIEANELARLYQDLTERQGLQTWRQMRDDETASTECFLADTTVLTVAKSKGFEYRCGLQDTREDLSHVRSRNISRSEFMHEVQ
jgi:hypothetical protein